MAARDIAPPAAPGDANARQVAPALVHSLLRAVRRAAGEEAFAKLLDAGQLPPDALDDQQRWFSSIEVVELAEAAERLCRNENLGARAGVELWRMMCERNGYVDGVRAAGSVAAAITAAAARGTKMSTGRTLAVVEVHDDHLVLTGEYTDLPSGSRFYCGLTTGFYAQVPRAFAMSGEIAEVACQFDGAERCVYRVSWYPDPTLAPVDAAELHSSAERAQRQIDQLEEVTQLTTELLAADRTDEVLARITAQAGRAVQAPRYLLAVRVNERDRLRVHHRGFARGEQEFAQRLLAGEAGESQGTLVADVVHGDRYFGRLAACYPRRSSFTELDRRLLRAYADHAAAVLQQVASLEHASNDRDTARALLELARALAGAHATREVTSRLAETVPRVVGSDVASLWMWDADAAELVLHAYVDVVEHTGFTGQRRLPLGDTPGLQELIESPSPRLLDRTVAADPVRRLLAETRVAQVAVVPIVNHGRFVGVICAGFRGELPDEDLLMGRLAGLADHAAVATQSVQAVEQISHQALHDNLTGLPNRRLMQEQAEQALSAAVRRQSRCALLFIDLDRFKNINDSLGHAAGDDMITQAAQRILGSTRPSDVLARFGGDEFVLLLPEVADVDAAAATGQRIVAALNEPFTVLGRHEVHTSASVGVACFPDHGRDYATLVRHADVAMYAAKNNGRNGIAVYRDGPAQRRPRTMELETQLRHAIDGDELRVHFQPQFDLTDGTLVAVEALVRWQHPTYGLLQPQSFLTVAEDSGVITQLDAFVRRTALRRVAEWRELRPALRLALNLSHRDVARPEHVTELLADIEAAGLRAGDVDVEISDPVGIDDERFVAAVTGYRAAGLRVVADDFGSGEGALLRLHRGRVDAVKIDPVFVAHVDAAGADAPVLDALVALVHSLGMTAVVAGVESVHQLQAARRGGANCVQGVLLAKPAPATSVTALLTSKTSVPAKLLRSSTLTGLPAPRSELGVSPSSSANVGRT